MIQGDKDQGNGYVRLTQSLLEALVYISRFWDISKSDVPEPAEYQKYIWIDQICINQKKGSEKAESEKAHQITVMDQIYSKADRVLVWLGCGLEYEQLASLIRFTQSSDLGDMRTIMHNPDVKTDLRDALQYVWSSPWLERSWVTQETGLAKDCLYLVGLHAFSFSKLALFANLAPKTDDCYINWRIGAFAAWEECSSSQRLGSKIEQGLQLFRFMMRSRVFKATNAKDKVMAYFSLWKPLATSFTAEDYKGDAPSVYTRMAAAIIQDTECLDLLGAHIDECRQTTLDPGGSVRVDGNSLPSWVPNWDNEFINRWCCPILRNTFVKPREIEWNTSRGRKHFSGVSSSDPNSLRTRGKVICSVESLFLTIPVLDDDVHRYDKFKEFLSHSTPGQIISLEEAVLAVLFFSSLKKSLKKGQIDDEGGSLLETIKAQQDAHQNAQRTQSEAVLREWIETSPPAWKNAVNRAGGRRFVVVKLIGEAKMLEEQVKIVLVPYNTKEKDVIAILHGCRFPVVLREKSVSGAQPNNAMCYEFVGDCYVQNIMFGEAVFWDEEEADKIVLI